MEEFFLFEKDVVNIEEQIVEVYLILHVLG